MEPKDLVYRCINDDTFDERGHIFSLGFQKSRTPCLPAAETRHATQ